MLQNMGSPCIVGGIGLKAHGEHIILVIPCNVDIIGPSLVVLELYGSQFEFWYLFCPPDSEAMQLIPGPGKLGQVCAERGEGSSEGGSRS